MSLVQLNKVTESEMTARLCGAVQHAVPQSYRDIRPRRNK
jgi:hypothetical protein